MVGLAFGSRIVATGVKSSNASNASNARVSRRRGLRSSSQSDPAEDGQPNFYKSYRYALRNLGNIGVSRP